MYICKLTVSSTPTSLRSRRRALHIPPQRHHPTSPTKTIPQMCKTSPPIGSCYISGGGGEDHSSYVRAAVCSTRKKHRGVSGAHQRANQRAADHVHQRYSEDALWRRARRGATPKGAVSPSTRALQSWPPAREGVRSVSCGDCAFLATQRAHYALVGSQ